MKRYVVGSAPLFPLAVSLIMGIVCAGQFQTGTSLWPLWLMAVVLAVVCWRWAWAQMAAIYACFFLSGMLLMGKSMVETKRPFAQTSRPVEGVIASEGAEKPRTVAFDVLDAHGGQRLKCYFAKDDRSLSLQPGDGVRLLLSDYKGIWFVPHGQWQSCRVRLEGVSLPDRSRLAFLRLRHRLLENYRLQGAQTDAYAVLAAMTLGDKSALCRELRDVYSVTGASHVLALSGLHLGILYFMLSLLAFRRGRRQVWFQAMMMVAVWSFVLLVGMPVSAVRSALMLSVFSLMAIGNRPHASVNVLSLSAIIILAVSPSALFDVGFQLSFASVLSILLFMPLLECWMPADWWQRHALWGRLWSLLAVSVAAQVGTAPLVAYYFGRFSTYFLLTNVVVMPAVTLILFGAMALLLWAPLGPVVVWLVATLNRLLTLLSRLPYASIDGLHPSVLQTILCYGAIGALYLALLRLNNLHLRP